MIITSRSSSSSVTVVVAAVVVVVSIAVVAVSVSVVVVYISLCGWRLKSNSVLIAYWFTMSVMLLYSTPSSCRPLLLAAQVPETVPSQIFYCVANTSLVLRYRRAA